MAVPDRLPDSGKELWEVAEEIRRYAYAPYSQFQIGAAVRAGSGKIYTGVNVENSSFGLTNCAERVAIQKAISEGEKEILEVLVLSDASPAWSPCGMCRQVMAEFAKPEIEVHFTNLDGESFTQTLAKLLPHAHKPSDVLDDSKK